MASEKKTKQQLINEIEKLRRRISELEKSESQCQIERKKRKESEERFRGLSETLFEGLLLHKKGILLDANKKATEMFGYNLKEVIGRNVLEFAAPESKEIIKKNILSGGEEPYEAKGVRKDGSVFPVELHGKQIKYKDQEARIAAIRDLTEQKKAEQSLKESGEKYSLVVENSNDAIIIHHDGIIQFANSTSSQFIGVPLSKLIGKPITDFVHPDYKKIVLDNFSKRKAGEDVEDIYEIALVRKDGSSFPAEINVSLIQYQGEPAGLVFIRDITKRKKTEEALREREQLLSNVFQSMQEGVLVLNTDFKCTYWNKGMEQISKIKREEVIGSIPWKKFQFIKGKIEEAMKKAMRGNVSRGIELKYSLPDGKEGWTTESYFPLKDAQENTIGVIGVVEDITELKDTEQKIKKSLEEKEVLLKEIHHRVKNNMQVISSLINIQANRIKDKKAREIFRNTRNRVMSMALVHERLYRSENLAGIDFKMYIERMSVHLMSYYRELSQNIELKTDVEDIFLDITKAVPLGLITNELISNSIKHAFSKRKKGKVTIEFYKKGKTYHLNIGDNGIGFPKDLDFRKVESMGMDLVNSLVKQINGVIQLIRHKGTLFKITFTE